MSWCMLRGFQAYCGELLCDHGDVVMFDVFYI